MRLLVRDSQYLAFPRQRLQPEPRPGGGVPHHSVQGADARTAQLSAGVQADFRPATRHRARHRADGLGQVHDARGHGQLHQRELPRAYPHRRGPDRVRAHQQELSDQSTRDRTRHARLQQRPAQRVARGSGHNSGGRNARPRNHPLGADRRRDRAFGVRHAAYLLGRQDHRPHHRRVPGGGKGHGARDAVGVAAFGDFAIAAEESRRRARGGARDHDRHTGDPQPDSRRQGRANVFLNSDRPADGHADARAVPAGAGAAAPGRRGGCPYHRRQQGTLRRRRGRRRERGSQALMVFSDLLKLMKHKKASDLFITAGMAPAIKVDGKLTPVTRQGLTPEQSRAFAYGIMNEDQRRQFEAHNECNFAIAPQDIGRFRVNVFMQQQRVGMVLRTINTEIPRFEDLHLPKALAELALTKRGLILFVGGTGSGKSTSLAAMVGYRNENSYGHIITIEDPIEYVHDHKNCLVTQREVGVDTESFETALKNTLRQAPDVILIGEIRARETMEYAIQFAETGHLCPSTLHANNANQALDRIINFFPEDKRNQLLMDLSLNLKAVVSQRLIPIKDGKGRVPAVEVMINSPLIADLIMEGKVPEIKELMSKSTEAGMQTFDQSLFSLFESDLISYDEALRNADSMNDLRLRVKLESKHAKTCELGASLKNIPYKWPSAPGA